MEEKNDQNKIINIDPGDAVEAPHDTDILDVSANTAPEQASSVQEDIPLESGPDKYARYESPSNGCEWNGSSYCGRPAQDREYSTYNTPAQPAGIDNSFERDFQNDTVNSTDTTFNRGYVQNSPADMQQDLHSAKKSAYSGESSYYGNQTRFYSHISSPVMKKVRKKKQLPRFVSTALTAILFGVIAAGTFFGSTKAINHIADSVTAGSDVSDIGTHSVIDGKIAEAEQAEKLKTTKLSDLVDTTMTDVSSVVEEVMPSMVQINVIVLTNSWFGTYESEGAGSGIVIGETDSELIIATNNHVVEGSRSISVTFIDGTTATATIKGTDPTADLGVVAVDRDSVSKETLDQIKVAKIGDSNTVKVGQMAIVIGNAMGYGQSTTVGYISQKEHEVTIDNQVMILLQTDAAINPGNSGGALINLDGEVIGIPSVKFASSSIEGMGFAIPISRAIDILQELGSREVLKDADKGYLGVYMQTVSESAAEFYNWPLGVYISEIVPGCAAEKAGILAGDIITEVNGVKYLDSSSLKECITSYRYGTEVKITLYRMDHGVYEPMEITVTLGQNPEYIKNEESN